MNKYIKKGLKILLLIMVLMGGGFFLYVSQYYKADDVALAVMGGQNTLQVKNDYIVLSSEIPSDTAMIFYPGAKVEYTAYLPILDKIRNQTNINIVLVKMPFNLAILDSNRADEILSNFPEIKYWYISGHSMGGAMASSYASKNPDKVEGLILLAAYIYGDFPEDRTLTIYGTLNTSVSDKIDYTKNVVAIEGGNHAQFGNYGKQKGDADALITQEEQQAITVAAIDEFIRR